MDPRQIITTLAIAWIAATVLSAQQPSGKPSVRPSPEEIAKLTAPGPEHAKLAGYAGDWDVSIKFGGATSTGTAQQRMTTGGRFLFIEFATQGAAGALEGTFTLGFDARHERFALMATDSYGTYFVTSQGKRDAATGKLRLLGGDEDPMMKSMGFTKEFMHVIDFRGPDEFVIEVHFVDTRTPERRELKAMEYVFKRKK